MKQIALLLCILSMKVSAQDYFPLEVGNTWTYYNSRDTLVYHVTDSVNIGNKKYFLYGAYSSRMDTIRKDIQGNIWKMIKGVDYLWFDFTKDNGATYTFPSFDSSQAYIIEVSKYHTQQTYLGTFSQCIALNFDVPQWVDDEIFYSFAPEVGLIEIYGGESPDYILCSAVLDGLPLKVANDQTSAPTSFALIQNYPNPFNPSTTIDYELHKSGAVNLSVFDILGRQVTTIVNKYQNKGEYRINFDGRGLASGIYLYSLKLGSYSITKKCVLLK
jgi:hypothetical protein